MGAVGSVAVFPSSLKGFSAGEDTASLDALSGGGSAHCARIGPRLASDPHLRRTSHHRRSQIDPGSTPNRTKTDPESDKGAKGTRSSLARKWPDVEGDVRRCCRSPPDRRPARAPQERRPSETPVTLTWAPPESRLRTVSVPQNASPRIRLANAHPHKRVPPHRPPDMLEPQPHAALQARGDARRAQCLFGCASNVEAHRLFG